MQKNDAIKQHKRDFSEGAGSNEWTVRKGENADGWIEFLFGSIYIAYCAHGNKFCLSHAA